MEDDGIKDEYVFGGVEGAGYAPEESPWEIHFRAWIELFWGMSRGNMATWGLGGRGVRAERKVDIAEQWAFDLVRI